MASTWLTYAWRDNEEGDVDFVAQELEAIGINVRLDRWELRAGERLWEQIAEHISDPDKTDAWILYATPNSLESDACKEELAYALNRALASRGDTFPIVALFPSAVDEALIPPAIKVRLFVSLTEKNWKERIKAAAEGRAPLIDRPTVAPYALTVHQPAKAGGKYKIEVRPRAGSWMPFVAAVRLAEKDELEPSIYHGPKGGAVVTSILSVPLPGEFESPDGEWWMMRANNEATPTQSYYIQCNRLPSEVLFGIFQSGRMTLYRHSFSGEN